MKVNVITTVGQTYLADAITNNTPLRISNIKVGAGVVTTIDEAKALSDLKDLKRTVGVQSVTKNGVEIRVSAPLNNINLASGFPMKEVGIYVLAPDNTEKLFWYINYDNEYSFIQSEDHGLIRQDLVYRLLFATDTITAINSSSGDLYVTKAYVDDELAKKLTVEADGKVTKDLYFGDETDNRINAMHHYAEKAFVNMDKAGSHSFGMGGTSIDMTIKFGLTENGAGRWMQDTPEILEIKKKLRILFDGIFDADRLRTRSGEVLFGEGDYATIKYNKEENEINFLFRK